MPAERYYNPRHFEIDDDFYFEDQEFHHFLNVMRTRVGESIEVINGKGQLATALVVSIEKKRALVKVTNLVNEEQPKYKFILAQGIPRTNRLEYILEKCTELGVTEIWLFNSTNSEKRTYTDHQLERLNTILISAMKQCGRLYLPKLCFVKSLSEFPNSSLGCYYGDTSPDAPSFVKVLSEQHEKNGSLICIGPEGGFTADEHKYLKSQGYIGIKLHNNILRTDTAAIAALSLMSQIIL